MKQNSWRPPFDCIHHLLSGSRSLDLADQYVTESWKKPRYHECIFVGISRYIESVTVLVFIS